VKQIFSKGYQKYCPKPKNARFPTLLLLLTRRFAPPDEEQPACADLRIRNPRVTHLLMGTMAKRMETPGEVAIRYRATAAAARRRARSSDWTTRLTLLQTAEKYMAAARNADEGARRRLRSSGQG
jgi:hypothetical protein